MSSLIDRSYYIITQQQKELENEIINNLSKTHTFSKIYDEKNQNI